MRYATADAEALVAAATQAGEAWGHRANDWSCLWEHYSLDVLLAMFAALGIAPGVDLLDIACRDLA